MPHSVASQSPSLAEDDVLPDAPSNAAAENEEEPSQPDSQQDDVPIKTEPFTNSAPPIMQETKLEDLFADMDDEDDAEDDEFPTSSASAVKVKTDIPALPPSNSNNASDPEIMRAFYQRLFPFRYLFQWLNHSITPSTDFGHREFAFTLQNDAYLRYQSFPTAHLLRKEILRLLPSRFEIGPVYTTNPRDRKTLRKSTNFRPLAKELVFDIDLTDYDEIRTCCDKANICHKCWEYITMAIKVVHSALTEDFGFEHILWVYSGRRGAHAWICDKRAREMTDQQRRAVAGYLEVIKGGSQSGKKVNVKRPLHPHLSRSLQLLAPHFSHLLTTQDPFLDPPQHARLLALLTQSSPSLAPLTAALAKKWDSSPFRPSLQKWSDIDSVAKTLKSLDTRALLEAKQDVVLEYSYPRLDVEVSKKLIHLLKSPFVVHPGTGRVCVPIPVGRDSDGGCDGGEGFDFEATPRVGELLAEIDRWDATVHADEDEEKGRKRQDWEKTGLRPYVGYFRDFVAGVMRAEARDSAVIKTEEGDAKDGNTADAMEF